METMNVLMVQMGNEYLEMAVNQVSKAFDFVRPSYLDVWLLWCSRINQSLTNTTILNPTV